MIKNNKKFHIDITFKNNELIETTNKNTNLKLPNNNPKIKFMIRTKSHGNDNNESKIESINNNNNNKNNKIIPESQSERFKNVMIKYTVLTSMSFISSLIVLILVLIFNSSSIIVIEYFIQCLCLLLMSNWYSNLFLCLCIAPRKIIKCCIIIMENIDTSHHNNTSIIKHNNHNNKQKHKNVNKKNIELHIVSSITKSPKSKSKSHDNIPSTTVTSNELNIINPPLKHPKQYSASLSVNNNITDIDSDFEISKTNPLKIIQE